MAGRNKDKGNDTKEAQQAKKDMEKEAGVAMSQSQTQELPIIITESEDSLVEKDPQHMIAKIQAIPILPINKGIPIYVMDTSYLIHDPLCLKLFKSETAIVVIPFVVLEELDKVKASHKNSSRDAREVNRYLQDAMKAKGPVAGVYQMGKTYLVYTMSSPEFRIPDTAEDYNDNIILEIAMRWQAKYPEHKVLLKTKDINLAIKADCLGLFTDDILESQTEALDLYSKNEYYRKLTLTDRQWEQMSSKNGSLPLRQIKADFPILPNQCFTVYNDNKMADELLVSSPDNTSLLSLNDSRAGIMNHTTANISIKPHNLEQWLASYYLLNPDIRLVFLIGKAGTGKTLLALTMGLNQLDYNDSGIISRSKAREITGKDGEEESPTVYRRVIIARPVVAHGEDIGYLPGDIKGKLGPWMQPIYDNCELLMPYDIKGSSKSSNKISSRQELESRDLLQIEALSHIRGRSIPGQFMIVDEAQNLTPHEVKTIITRAGKGTKVIFTGDPWQIDNPYVDSRSNGLVVWSEKARGQKFAATVLLNDGVRSEMAEWASNQH